MRSMRPNIRSAVALALAPLLALFGCGDDSSGGVGGTTGSSVVSSASVGSGGGEGGQGGKDVGPCGDTDLPEEDLGGGADPEMGMFTLDEALAGLPEGPGPLRAVITTDVGATACTSSGWCGPKRQSVRCELLPEVAPNGVANFVGLARGRRPFKDTKTKHWIKGRRFYDGLKFHRVIDNFVAQGGDPLGTGTGGPGYKFADEIGSESHVPGTLAYANSGPNTNGSQFYIVAEQPALFLDGGYTIFGHCTPVAVPKAISEVPTDANDAPIVPIHSTHVAITRCGL
jgi:peptidyl-prolyl cis-trans isomerase A (cyclophilin A)